MMTTIDQTTVDQARALYWIAVAAVWFAPCVPLAWIGSAWMGKSGYKILACGAILGILGSVVAMVCLPRLDAEPGHGARKAVTPAVKPAARRSEQDDTLRLVLMAMGGIAVLIVLALMVMLLAAG